MVDVLWCYNSSRQPSYARMPTLLPERVCYAGRAKSQYEMLKEQNASVIWWKRRVLVRYARELDSDE